MLCNVIYGITNGSDFFCIFVGDIDAKLIFEFHDQLNSIQGISAQIVGEASFVSNFTFFYTKFFNYDGFYFRFNF